MKTVKLKACNGITIANQNALTGKTPSGAIIFEVKNVPDTVSIQEVYLKFKNTTFGYLGLNLDWNND
jgi:hypothetical protein